MTNVALRLAVATEAMLVAMVVSDDVVVKI
jgi:hypothetical protein